jgi:RNA polymerase sigma factor (sigma-70 family)
MYQISNDEYLHLALWARWLARSRFGLFCDAAPDRPWGVDDPEDFVAGSVQTAAVRAARRFRPSRGAPFFHWASRRVHWEMLNSWAKTRRRAQRMRIQTSDAETLERAAPRRRSRYERDMESYLDFLDDPGARELLRRRFVDGLSQGQAADRMGLTQSRVAQMEADALREIRQRLNLADA